MRSLLNNERIPIYIFLAFILLHLVLFNINGAEWGDTYRILRASEYVKEFDYPENEKRPPLFSILLALSPGLEQIFWGRIIMLVFSIASLVIFYKLAKEYFKENEKTNLALILFAFNPVYLYWSLRVMSDAVFSFFVILAAYLLVSMKTKIDVPKVILLGVVVGMATLTRFEGYILLLSVGLGLLFVNGLESKCDLININNIVTRIVVNYKRIGQYLLGFFVVIGPYMVLNNPFDSAYFEEPERRVYDYNTLVIFLLATLFLFGFVSAFYFFFYNRRNLINFFTENIGLSFFVLIELVLILLWPAAIPRLFIPIIPLLVIPLSDSIYVYFKNGTTTVRGGYALLIINILLLGVYMLGQLIYKLQFNVLIKPVFVVILVISVVQIVLVHKKYFEAFVVSIIAGMILWSVSTVWIHRNILKTLVDANQYVLENLEGNFGVNDATALSKWYLKDSNTNDNITYKSFDITKDNKSKYNVLVKKDFDYFLVTNEHDVNVDFGVDDKEHLDEIAEFTSNANNKVFFTKVIKFTSNDEEN